LRGTGGVAHAPSLLLHLCWGAYRAAQTAARSNSGAGANIEASKELPRLAYVLARRGVARRDRGAHRSGGPTAPWSSVPLLGPLWPRLLERVDDADVLEVGESWQVLRVKRACTSFHARRDDQGIPQRRSSREMELFRASQVAISG